MNKHKQIDLILKYMSENLEEIPSRPDVIIRKSNLNIQKTESYRIFRLLLSDGYVYEHLENGVYGITYKGMLFLENGGYEFEQKKYKLQKTTTRISNVSDIVVKPIGIITAFIVSFWYIIKLLEFFGIIKSCVD
jgi:predicted transcriptional regulator